MASAFIGLKVGVVLKEPPLVIRGLVSDVKNQQLYLRDVHFVQSGYHWSEYTIHGAQVADIEILPNASSSTILGGSPHIERNHASTANYADQNKPLELSGDATAGSTATAKCLSDSATRKSKNIVRNPEPLTDPAILSFTRTYSPSLQSSAENAKVPENLLDASRHIEREMEHALSSENQKDGISSRMFAAISKPQESKADLNVSANLTTTSDISQLSYMPHVMEDGNESFAVDTLNQPTEQAPEIADDMESMPAKKSTAKRRRRGRAKPKINVTVPNELETPPEDLKKSLNVDSIGWRQTPILRPQAEPSYDTLSRGGIRDGIVDRGAFTPITKKSKRQTQLERQAASGWATEDASDVHGMGDFDFEANLSRFDKLAVWDELRNGDTTADEDRLVSLNRVKPAAPGTFGGKKLPPTENVLDHARTSSPGSENESGIGSRVTSRRMLRDLSKGSNRQLSFSKGSLRAVVDSIGPAHSDQPSAPIRSLSQAKNSDSHGAASPRLPGHISPSSSALLSPLWHDASHRPFLRNIRTDNICRTMTPETIEAVEILAQNGFGMSEDMVAENAGRCIAEVALSTLSPKGHRLAQVNHNSLPVVVVLVGDNKVGGRALAASRHLLERGVRIVATLTGPVDLENGPLRNQVHRFRGKFLRTWTETTMYLKTLDAPPELIIDALLGLQSSFENLEKDHLSTASDMIEWANNSKASILSIDLPSGVDSRTAQDCSVNVPEVRARAVICCGAPSSSLLDTMIARLNGDDWQVFVADIGINPAAKPFLKVNTNKEESNQRGKYIHFGSDWVIRLRYDAGNSV